MMTRPRFRPAITGFGVLLIFGLGVSPGLAAAADVDDILLEQANQAGSVRVQVDLAAPAEADQADEIDRTAEDVLFALPSGSYQGVEREAGSARMSLQVDAAALDALAAAPEVAAIAPAAMPAAMQRLAAGGQHSLAIEPDGSLWSWGHGWIGDGTWSYTNPVPVRVMEGVSAVAAGSSHSLAIKSDGELWAWGHNADGPIGDGTTTERLSPVHVMTGVSAVAAGSYHTLALKTDGTLWAWGDNTYGQVGDSSNNDRLSPVYVMSGVVAIAAGSSHSFAITTDGSLWAWGKNFWGGLGDGTGTNRSTPLRVMEGVSAVAGGYDHSLAIKSDGTLWAWGGNWEGEIGDGTTTHRYSPVQVMRDVSAVSAGFQYTLAVKFDGTLWAWGSNNGSGKLGIGSQIDQRSPVYVVDGVAGIGAGSSHSLAFKTDGSLWAWGVNRWGQLGNGKTISRSRPVAVIGFGLTKPAAPSNLAAIAASSSRINLSWSDNSSSEQGFRVQRRSGGGDWGHVATVSPNVNSYVNVGLVPGTTYTYRVVAFGAGGALSPYSNEATATTQGGTVTKPAAPSNLVARAASRNQINLIWRDRSTNEQGFRIERKIGTAAWVQIDVVAANTTSYANVGLRPNTSYTYRVRAFNAGGTSVWATSTAVKTPR